jgi:uncharacterized protein
MLRFASPFLPGSKPVAKLLVFLLILLGIYLIRRAVLRPPGPSPRAGEPVRPDAVSAERMIECAQCGLHVPESEAVTGEGLSFCCEAHRQAHRKTPGARG